MRAQRLWVICAAALGLVTSLEGCAARATSSAESALTVATAPDQNDAERRALVRLELASLYFGRGQSDTALDEVKLAIVAKPDLADAHNLRAMIYAAMGEDRLADESISRALQISPSHGATLHNQAWLWCQRGRHAQAQAQFEALLALPQYRDVARTQLARGLCFGRNGQWVEAESALMRAYELAPANPSAGVNLAEVLLQRRDFERARFYIARVNDGVGTSNAQTLWLAVRIERKLGRETAVRQFGERLREQFPQSPEASLFERGRFDD